MFSVLLQQLTVAPYPSEAGAPVVVQLRSAAGPIAGQPLRLELASGEVTDLGATDAGGQLHTVAPAAGLHRITGSLGEVRIVVPWQVVPVPPRWLYAVVCVPLGLGLLWRNLRRRDPRRA